MRNEAGHALSPAAPTLLPSHAYPPSSLTPTTSHSHLSSFLTPSLLSLARSPSSSFSLTPTLSITTMLFSHWTPMTSSLSRPALLCANQSILFARASPPVPSPSPPTSHVSSGSRTEEASRSYAECVCLFYGLIGLVYFYMHVSE